MRKSTTRRALFLSFVSMFLCFTMLIGTTYAWFTDTVNSGVNTIVAGNLDVELEYAKVTDGVQGAWTGVKDSEEIFDPNAKWEPGHAEVVYLKVSNLGNLALKYQLSFNVIDATKVTVDGQEYSFADMLKVALIKDDPAAPITPTRDYVKGIDAQKWHTLQTIVEPGQLLADADLTDADKPNDVYLVVVYWEPSDKDNYFNINNNRTDGPVEAHLGINLFATQAPAEADSFDNMYDDPAWVLQNADAVVENATELEDALADGGLVALANDFDGNLTIDNVAEGTILNFAGNTVNGTVSVAEGQSITLNGQGGVAATGTAPAVKVAKNTDVTLAGGTYTSENTAILVSNRTEAPMTLTIEEGTVITAPTIINLDQSTNYAGAKVVINGGEFNSTYEKSDARPIKVHGGDITINGGTFTIDNPTGKNCYFVDISSTYNTANDGTNKYIMGKVEINGGTFKSNVPYTRAVFASISKGHTLGTVEINGGYYEFTEDNSYLVDVPANVIVNDCTYIGVNTANVFNISSTNPADQTIVVNGGNYTVRTSPAGCFNYSYASRVILKGGTINSNKKLTESLAAGYKVVDNGNGTYSIVAE